MQGRVNRRRRDRRGRGVRGELLAPGLPAYRNRAQRFDDLVLDAVEHLEERWAEQLAGVELAVEDVPLEPAPGEGELPADPVALARLEPGHGSGATAVPPRIVLYRRPIEARGQDQLDLAELVFDVLVHEVADLLGVEPEVIDPEGHPPGD